MLEFMFRAFNPTCLSKLGIISLFVLLSSCGGGGGGDPQPIVAPQPKLVANAGTDATVLMSQLIKLDPKVLVANATTSTLSSTGLDMRGSSTRNADIVALTWLQTEGPALEMRSSGFNDGVITFTAPTTNNAPSVEISFKLTLKNAAGETAEDSITFTVLRVNQKPTATTDSLINVKGSNSVTLDGSASKDVDGTVQKYTWLQTSGTSVTLNATDIAKPTFTAPNVTAPTTLEFQLTVADNEGATNTASVTVKVAPNGNPEVAMYFPPSFGIYNNSTLSAFGKAKALDADLVSLTVDVGNGPIAATIAPDGTWNADNLEVPANTAEVTLKVAATDSLGRIGEASSTLKTSSKYTIGTGQTWDKSIDIVVDNDLNKLFVLNRGNSISKVRLMSVDLNNGNRSEDISNFATTSQGLSNTALIGMGYDPANKLIYATAAPADASILTQIFSINVLTGQRQLVSDQTRGTGPELQLPYGIAAYDPTNLFVADNLSGTILAVDKLTGNRTVIADTSTVLYKMDVPTLLEQDALDEQHRLVMIPNKSGFNYVLGINPTDIPATSYLITDSSDGIGSVNFMGLPDDFAVDNSINRVFILDYSNDIIAINTQDGKRSKLASMPGLSTHMTYNANKHLIYVVDDFPCKLYVVNPYNGQTVSISQSIAF